MFRVLKTEPRKVWRISIMLLPLWLAIAGASYRWISNWPVTAETVRLPEVSTTQDEVKPIHMGSIQSYSCIWQRPLRQELIDKKLPPTPKPRVQQRPVNLALVGTAVEENGGYAFLRTRGGQMKVARLGSLVDSFLVASIQPHRVCLNRDGTLTYLTLPKATRRIMGANVWQKAATKPAKITYGTTAPPGLEVALTKEKMKIIQLYLNCTAQEFLKDVRLVPCLTTTGRQHGFRIDSISKGSSLVKAGLAPGDIIVAVDKQRLSKIADMDRLYSSLEDGNAHNWDVRRENAKLDLRIVPSKDKQK